MAYADYVMPASQRAPKWSLSMAWWALFSAMFWIYVAVASAGAYGLVNTLIGMALTIATYGAINFVLSRYAAKTGLTVELLSRSIFGRIGSALATLIFAATAIYYCVFEGSIIAVAFQKMWGGPIEVWYAVVVIYAIPLAAGPVQRWLDRLNGYLLPIYAIGLIAVVVVALMQHGVPASIYPAPADLPIAGWLGSYLIYMGVWIMMMYTFDYARMGKEEDKKFHGTFTFGWVFYFFTFAINGLVGIYIIAATGHEGSETGVVDAFLGTLGFFGLLVIFISQTRINTANYYLASTNLDAFATRVFRLTMPRWVWVAVAGVITFVLMLTNVVSWLLVALAWQGVFVVAWVAIALVYIAMHRDSQTLPEVRGEFLKPLAPGAAAWVISAGLGIYLTTAFGATPVGMLAPIVTFVLAAVLAAVAFSMQRPATVPAEDAPKVDEQALV